ncbi:heterogeneous nuclear ribonucleoprotein L-like [Peromyscus leucopus]|uniref:heterogeneous nuclear ribonucleoprotein L-like n=1 Tax=Peromyscus leucopus TaxID=10041 RepID=UPI0010A12C9A|nr:heterogeneous nuclear ribonucleoprotein L-like [Peromyscus leucopus]
MASTETLTLPAPAEPSQSTEQLELQPSKLKAKEEETVETAVMRLWQGRPCHGLLERAAAEVAAAAAVEAAGTDWRHLRLGSHAATLAAAMSSSTTSSSPKEETYEEEDREFESQAKRLKTEEGDIGYSAEESETRQEATPQAGSDSDSDKEEGEGDDGDEDEGGSGGDEGGSGGGGPRSVPQSMEGGGSHHQVSVSPVVHAPGLCESVVEADLVEALEKFGTICYVMMMLFKGQALVEFENVDSAKECVTFAADEPVYNAGQQAFFNYSASKRITRPGNTDDPSGGNKVLLLSIQNPLYPITVDVLYTVCNPVGKVQRIVIFKRNGMQAMVEFESVLCAQKAKAALNGADIYAGCCTLKIEYARPTRLNVTRNDNDSWDYTKPYLGRRDRGKGLQRQAILGDHPSSFRHDGYGSHGPLLPLPSRYRMGSRDTAALVAYPLPQASSSYMHGGSPSGSVVMVSGLHQLNMNCSRVFNLFCLYGNIEKVKFMKTIPGTALVEMGDKYAVERAVTHLNNVKLFGKRLNVCVSKQHSVVPSQVFELEDGTSSYKDFAMSKNNRFTSAGQASKNIIQPPSCVLHYYNVPLCVTEETFTKLCNDHEVLPFIKYKVYDGKASAKTLSGLLEWKCKTDKAVEALTALNHYQIRVPNGSNPYTLKLCISTSSHLQEEKSMLDLRSSLLQF